MANHSCEVDDAIEVTKCRGVTEEQKKWATNLFGKAPVRKCYEKWKNSIMKKKCR